MVLVLSHSDLLLMIFDWNQYFGGSTAISFAMLTFIRAVSVVRAYQSFYVYYIHPNIE